MKRLFFAGVTAAVFCAAPALAADMAVKAPPAPPAPAWSWTGFYVGADIGGAWINDNQFLSSPTFALAVPDKSSGVIGGGHAGYNWQTGQFVLGVEADFDGSSVKNTYVIGPPFVNTTGTTQLNWQGSIRGRLGVAFDRALLYATGGWAYGRFTDGYSTAGTAFVQSVSSNRSGGTVGAGIEYAFTNKVSGRVEYRYTGWRTSTNNLNVFLAPPGTSVDNAKENQVAVGVSYKLN